MLHTFYLFRGDSSAFPLLASSTPLFVMVSEYEPLDEKQMFVKLKDSANNAFENR